MKQATANQLADAVIAMLETNRLSAEAVLEALLDAPISMSARQRHFARIGYRSGFVQMFKSKPEPSQEKLAEALAMFAALKNAPHKMRSLLKRKLKELPPPPGGAPRKVKPQDEAIVCTEILTLKAVHDTREAIRRVAKKRGVSERTVYRIWGKQYPKKKSASK